MLLGIFELLSSNIWFAIARDDNDSTAPPAVISHVRFILFFNIKYVLTTIERELLDRIYIQQYRSANQVSSVHHHGRVD